jgi:hypothetical protein
LFNTFLRDQCAYYEVIDLEIAMKSQTILADEMNGVPARLQITAGPPRGWRGFGASHQHGGTRWHLLNNILCGENSFCTSVKVKIDQARDFVCAEVERRRGVRLPCASPDVAAVLALL